MNVYLQKLIGTELKLNGIDTELTIPNTKHPFFITVDASLIGLGAVLFQLKEQNQMKVISYNSRILNPQEQKLSTLYAKILVLYTPFKSTNLSL